MAIGSGDVLRTTCNFQLGDGSQYQNVFHHDRHGIGIDSDATHVAAIKAWCDTMYSELNAETPDDIVEVLSSVDRVEFVGGAWTVVENIGTFTPAFVPAADTDPMPNQISSFVTFKTARPQSVGRKFLFPFTELDLAAGIMDAGLVVSVVAWADDAVNNIVIDAPLDYLSPGIVRTGVDAFLEFTLAVVTNLVGTQRRRRPGYGA